MRAQGDYRPPLRRVDWTFVGLVSDAGQHPDRPETPARVAALIEFARSLLGSRTSRQPGRDWTNNGEGVEVVMSHTGATVDGPVTPAHGTRPGSTTPPAERHMQIMVDAPFAGRLPDAAAPTRRRADSPAAQSARQVSPHTTPCTTAKGSHSLLTCACSTCEMTAATWPQ